MRKINNNIAGQIPSIVVERIKGYCYVITLLD